MTQENKNILLKDLCARLPYGNTEIKATEPTNDMMGEVFVGKHICSTIDIEDFIIGKYIIRPYLRPLSSMTEEERKEFRGVGLIYKPQNDTWMISVFTSEAYDWLNKKGFDYRGLIPMGLAIEAPEGMYKTEYLSTWLQEKARNYQDKEKMRIKQETMDRIEWLAEIERDRRNGCGTD